MSGRYVVQLENGPAVRVRAPNLAKFDSASLESLVAAEDKTKAEGTTKAEADRQLCQAMKGDDNGEIDVEALKVAINELHAQASPEMLKAARSKREQLKEHARKATKAEAARQRKVRSEAEKAIAAAAAAEESARAAALEARTAAAKEVATRLEEENARRVEAALCVICLDKPKTHVFVPCGHYSCCAECCDSIVNGPEAMRLCPLCKGAITMAVKVFG
eukprot:1936785-Prymnesium_polylepis.2